MDENTRQALATIWAFIEYLTNDEDHDRQLVLEGTQRMIEDLALNGHLGELAGYVRRYTRLGPAEAASAALAIADRLSTL